MSPGLLALWSVPRARSTAFLRMMVERGDCEVLHEPFSRVVDFGATEIGGRAVRSVAEVMDALTDRAATRRVFIKDTLDFRYPQLLADPSFLAACTSSFMVRDPRAAIASHLRLAPHAPDDSMGFGYLEELLQAVQQASDRTPLVMDGDDLLVDADAVVRQFCCYAGLPFLAAAMQWDAGTLPAWDRTQRWHQDVANSSGFTAPSRESPSDPPSPADPRLDRLVALAQPAYDRMRALRPQPALT